MKRQLRAYNLNNAAERLGIGRRELERLIERGEIKAYNMGGAAWPTYMLLDKDIENYEAGKVTAE